MDLKISHNFTLKIVGGALKIAQDFDVNSRRGLGISDIVSRERELGFRELKEGEKGRRENLSLLRKNSQNSHKFAHNELHTGACGSLCKFENVMFSKENRTHKSHIFAQCEQNDHA